MEKEKITKEDVNGAAAQATEIPISSIQSFRNHPFKVMDDDRMKELVQSVKDNGILNPVLVRPAAQDGFEMISGHRRMHAAKLAGLTTVPAIIKEMTDDEAVIAMVDSNMQREELLPSEREQLVELSSRSWKMKTAVGNKLERNRVSVAVKCRNISVLQSSQKIS